MKHNRRRSPHSSRRSPSVLDRIQVDVAGIDCGATEHYVSVPPDRDPTPIQAFRTFTADLHRLADWLVACRVTSVAMEATGVYWIPVFDILEARGLEVLLVNARHVKHVPGRKSDVEDCEWLRELRHGVLSISLLSHRWGHARQDRLRHDGSGDRRTDWGDRGTGHRQRPVRLSLVNRIGTASGLGRITRATSTDSCSDGKQLVSVHRRQSNKQDRDGSLCCRRRVVSSRLLTTSSSSPLQVQHETPRASPVVPRVIAATTAFAVETDSTQTRRPHAPESPRRR